MGDLLDYAPIAAAAFAIPQFLPQLLKLRATNDTAGVSWSWATLTGVNNAAWFLYFALASYWTALVPAASATLLASTLAIMLAIMLARRGQARPRGTRTSWCWAPMSSGSCSEQICPTRYASTSFRSSWARKHHCSMGSRPSWSQKESP
jgi:uncharacterized protein with PQ loop repeat